MREKLIAVMLCLALIIGGSACTDTTLEYDLIVEAGDGGSVPTPGEGTHRYQEGTEVELVATPADGYEFVNWSGDVDTIDDVLAASTTITMNDDYTITANFEVSEVPSILITRYDEDGTTILAQETRTYLQMESEFDVYGDGEIEYFHQGPTFDDDNLWDPDETENLKSVGVVKGTDLVDLCALVDGVSPGDTVQVRASDGLSRTFQYESVYGQEPGHPRFVITWWRAGDGYVPDYESGMRLVMFTDDAVFGNYDMQQYLHEDDWHYYDIYPSSHGLSVKWVSEILIYAGTIPEWQFELAGAQELTVTQSYFEEGLACSSGIHRVEYDDGQGSVWSGIPLWLLVAMMDDDPDEGTSHINFNDDFAAAGYTVRVVAGDGFSAEFDSDFVARNNDLILANLVNGEPLEGGSYPLRIAGPDLTGRQRVGNVVRIELEWKLELVGAQSATVTQSYFEEALACGDHSAEYFDGTNTWSGIPLWLLVAMVDDDPDPADPHYSFDDDLAAAGYDVKVIAYDGFSTTFDSAFVARNGELILANRLNGEPLGGSYPLRIAGPGLSGKQRVGNVVRIELVFPEP